MATNQYVPQFKIRSSIHAGEGGGYVNGVWYADKSGICGGPVPPQPTPPTPTPPTPTPPVSGGGWVNGVWYPDKSGICG
jgi:hypothetical protein